jgi:hypothetical protein
MCTNRHRNKRRQKREKNMSLLILTNPALQKKQQTNYAIGHILCNMNIIESQTRCMFQEIYPQLEKDFHKAFDSNNLRALRVLLERLNKLVDYHNGQPFDGNMPEWAKAAI